MFKEEFLSSFLSGLLNNCINMFILNRGCDLKNSGKYGSGRWALFTACAFKFKLHRIFHGVEFKNPIWYSIWWIFVVGIGAFRVFNRTRLNIEPYSPLKPTKVGFIFIGPNSLSRAEDLAAVNHVTQAVVRVGSKIGS